jgi:DNA-directed RNA polymerase subunit RPC12/RpoP
MGSVIDYIECVNCKAEAYSDYYYKTGEEYINCNNCGYHYSATIKSRNKNLNELTDKDWNIQECINPFGAYRLKYKDEVGTTCGSLRNKAEWNEFKKEVQADDQVEYFQLSRFINGEIVVEHVI